MSKSEIGANEIIEWLDSQSDFTLEMKALSHIKSLGFHVEHGGTYEDPATKLPRQFDIRAKAYNGNEKKCCIKLAVECKALSEDFPLVIQRVPRHENESFHEIYHAHVRDLFPNRTFDEERGHSLALPGPEARILRTQFESKIYKPKELVGKSSNQIGRKRNTGELFANDKEVYNKWAQAIASAHDLIFECIQEREQKKEIEIHTVVFPVLVVPDGCLWAVDYDLEGNRTTKPMVYDQTSVFIGKEHSCRGLIQGGSNYTLSHLEVMTLSGYRSFTNKISSNIAFWEAVFSFDAVYLRN